jgi:hypothetical protein
LRVAALLVACEACAEAAGALTVPAGIDAAAIDELPVAAEALSCLELLAASVAGAASAAKAAAVKAIVATQLNKNVFMPKTPV